MIKATVTKNAPLRILALASALRSVGNSILSRSQAEAAKADIYNVVRDSIRKQLVTEGKHAATAAEYTPWEQLRDYYKLYKEGARPGRRILEFDGTMYLSLTRGNADTDSRVQRYKTGPGTTSLRIVLSYYSPQAHKPWKNKPFYYAYAHQYGTQKMPRREILNPNKDDKAKIRRIIEKQVQQGIRGIFRKRIKVT
jgi:hypothetical protein